MPVSPKGCRVNGFQAQSLGGQKRPDECKLIIDFIGCVRIKHHTNGANWRLQPTDASGVVQGVFPACGRSRISKGFSRCLTGNFELEPVDD